MSTILKPELSSKNPYWINKHRYYELKHFCLQYPLWKREYDSLIRYSKSHWRVVNSSKDNVASDYVTDHIDERLQYARLINLIESAAMAADENLAGYILLAVTEGIPYDRLRAITGIPCCRDTYYDLYRRFFWILSDKRQ